MKHNDFIGVYPNSLDKETCDRIIQYFDDNYKHPDNSDCKIKSGYGSHETERGHLTRHDYQWYLSSDNPAASLILQVVDHCWERYVEKFWVVNYISTGFEEVKLQKTPPRGGFHDWHCEINDLGVVDRCIAWMLYLNDIPEGEGETEFLWQGLRVQPKAGTMLIWPAFFTHTHRGNPVYSCDKYIATGWGLYESNEDVALVDVFNWDDDKKIFTGRKN
jgi:hypothetical protein